MLHTKAVEIVLLLSIEFACSVGWVDCFRRRHGLLFRSIVWEAAAVDEAACDDWKATRLKTFLKEYSLCDVYSVNKTVLLCQLLLGRILALAGDTYTRGKHCKQRITILIGGNMTGTNKPKLLVISKAKLLWCFKNVKMLPVKCAANSKVWMTQAVLEQ